MRNLAWVLFAVMAAAALLRGLVTFSSSPPISAATLDPTWRGGGVVANVQDRLVPCDNGITGSRATVTLAADTVTTYGTSLAAIPRNYVLCLLSIESSDTTEIEVGRDVIARYTMNGDDPTSATGTPLWSGMTDFENIDVSTLKMVKASTAAGTVKMTADFYRQFDQTAR